MNPEYYNDPKLWGKEMSVSIKDIVESYMANLEKDDYTYGVAKRRVVRIVKDTIRDLHFTTLKKYESIEMDLGPTLQVPLPYGYVDYLRISWVDEEGTLYPLTENHRLALGLSALQDHAYKYLLDANGEILNAEGSSPSIDNMPAYSNGFNVDRGAIYENGYFKVDKNSGYIKFGSDAYAKTIKLEYITDGLTNNDDSTIRVHKFALNFINEDTYFKLIERKRNVPDREKSRARRARNISKKVLNNLMNPVREEDVLQVARGASRWVKQA